MKAQLTRNDLLFMVDTLMPGTRDRERAADVIAADEQFIDTMLDDDGVFERFTNDGEVILHVSPWLFFTVLLRRAQREMKRETFTIERRNRQKVVLFDADRVVRLLETETLRDYLAALLASFTRINSVTVPVRVKRGIWRKYRINDLDVESMMRYGEAADRELRFELYKRIADVCLFMAGVFPDYIRARHRYPVSGAVRFQTRGRLLQTLEDYEGHGRAFYRLAAEHERARAEGLEELLTTLSQEFVLAEKPLAFLADRYLRMNKNRLFDV